jgi:hypothetical protein
MGPDSAQILGNAQSPASDSSDPTNATTRAPAAAPYSEQFAAVLAERRGHPLSPGKIGAAPASIHRGLSPDDARHLPDLIAAGLAFLLLTGTGAASWYAIIGALPRDAQMMPGTPIAASDVRGVAPLPLPTALAESGPPVPRELREAIAASPAPVDWSLGEVWLPAALDPVLSEPVPAIETAVAPVAPPATKPVPDVVARTAETYAVPEVSTDLAEVPADQTSPPGAGPPVISGSGDSQDRPGASFFSDPYPEKPASGLSSVTTASRLGGGGTGNHSAPTGRSSSASAGSDPNADTSGSNASPGDDSSDSSSDTGGSNASPGGDTSPDGGHTKSGGHQSGGNSAAPGGKAKDHAKGSGGADQGGKQGKDAKESHGGKGPGVAGQGAKDNKSKDHGDKNKDKGKSGGKDHGDKDKGGKGNGKAGD